MKIKLSPIDKEFEANPNKTLMQNCHDNQFELKSLCKGGLSCAECRVRILSGEGNVIPPTKAELALLGSNYFVDGRRLGCQLRCFGDVTIDVTEHLDRTENVNKKVRGFRLNSKDATKAVRGTLVLQEGKQDSKQDAKDNKD